MAGEPRTSVPVSTVARFCRTRLLKQGTHTATWLGLEQPTGRTVVIKTIDRGALSSTARLLLMHEADALAELQGPHIPRFVSLLEDDDSVTLVVEHVPGRSLRRWLEDHRATWQEALSVGIAVLHALEEAHARQILHRDIKPENVLVPDDGGLAAALLLDFGLSRGRRLHADVATLAVGTLRYMSPEVAGLIQAELTPAADLYSLGIMIYELIAGRPPFPHREVGDLLQAHLSAPVPPLPGVPPLLNDLLAELLGKAPEERYQSAPALRHDLERLAGGETDFHLRSRDIRQRLGRPRLVGRDGELDRLTDALQAARRGQGRLLVIRGSSGSGKTRLMDELASRAGDAAVLRGGGLTGGSQVPYQMFQGIAHDLLSWGRADAGLAPYLRRGLKSLLGPCTRALPQLADLLGAPGRGLEGEQAPEALAALLCLLGQAQRPALVLLDDVQWAHPSSVQVLDLCAPALTRAHVLVVAGARDETGVDDRWPEAIDLDPLSGAEAEALVASMTGDTLPAEARRMVRELADGSPFAAVEVVRGMAETGLIRPTLQGWQWQDTPASLRLSQRGGLRMLERLDLLPGPTLEVATAAALLGRTVDLDLLATITRSPGGALVASLDLLADRGILWWNSDQTSLTFAHDRLRESCLSRLPDDRRRQLHRRAAEVMQGASPPQPHRLAWHFSEAGDPIQAAPFALQAAHEARATGDLDLAEQYYRRAFTGLTDPSALRRAHEGLGDVLTLRMACAEAVDHYLSALALEVDPAHGATLMARLATAASRGGDYGQAMERLTDGLSRLSVRLPRGSLEGLLALGRELVVDAWQAVRPPAQREDAAAVPRIHLLEALVFAAYFLGRREGMAWATWRAVNEACQLPPGPEVGRCYALHAFLVANLGFLRRADRYSRQAITMPGSPLDPQRGRIFSARAYVEWHSGRVQACLETYRQGVELLGQAGNYFDLEVVHQNVANVLYQLGRLPEARNLAHAHYRVAARRGDTLFMASFARAAVRAGGGWNAPDRWPATLWEPGDKLRLSFALEARGIDALYRGAFETAVASLEEACTLVPSLSASETGGTFNWLATACRTWAEQPGMLGGRRRDLYRRARRAARAGLAMASRFVLFRPHALRESAWLAEERGHSHRARRLIEESLTLSEDLGLRYEFARSLAARGRLTGSATDPPRALVLFEEMGATWELPVPENVSLVDRVEQLLSVGRRIVSAGQDERVAQAVLTAATALLRCQEVMVLQPEREGRFSVRAGRPFHYSISICQQALSEKQAIVVREGGIDPSDSLLLSEARSVLSCVIPVPQGTPWVLYAVHKEVGGLFGEVEQRLALWISALAGAALEGADTTSRLLYQATRLQERERKILAAEIHDVIAQPLVSMAWLLQQHDHDEGLRLARQTCEDLLDHLRTVSRTLADPSLEGADLATAVRQLTETFSQESGIDVDLHMSVEVCHQGGLIGLFALRIVQEALQNVRRHAAAAAVRVCLDICEPRLTIEIQDDGRGFDKDAVGAGHFGLQGMRDRAELLEGAWSIESSPGHGTCVRCTLPLRPAGEAL
ncbi:MAG TPA: AAA family ATPase [Candidatus Xenobia bacterium]|jgi:signal transduction histidine kinase